MISSRTQRAFTLVELLVVIAILAILMGLLFPAVQGALYRANKAKAQSDASQIVLGIKNYETEYNRLPDVGSEGDNANTVELMNILAGKDDDANPREMTFLEIPRTTNKRNGAESTGGNYGSAYYDPFGELYEVRIDTDYDNELEGPGGEEVRTSAIAWSEADSKKTQGDASKFAKTW